MKKHMAYDYIQVVPVDMCCMTPSQDTQALSHVKYINCRNTFPVTQYSSYKYSATISSPIYSLLTASDTVPTF